MRRLAPAGRALLGLVFPALCPLCRAAAPATPWGVCAPCHDGLQVLAPPLCTGCGGACDTMLALCTECLELPRPWTRGVSVFPHRDLGRTTIHRLKYRGEVAVAPVLARAAASAYRAAFSAPAHDALVPVPLHWFKEMRRGYNQTELVAADLTRELQLPLARLLVRRRYTPSQTRLSRAARLLNIGQAFALRRGAAPAVAGRRLLLLDDVFTTGATLSACTRVLLRAGAARVDVLTLARG